MVEILGKNVTLNNIIETIDEKLNKMPIKQRLQFQEFENNFNIIKEKAVMDYSTLQLLADWLTELSKTDNWIQSTNEIK